MLSKFEYSKNFLKNDDLLICPICKERLILMDHSLVCKNKHTYDISKKGITTLVSHSHIKESKIYNYELFLNRRNFIQKMYYKDLYDEIIHIINEHFNNKINIVDLGCGEGAHTMNILNLLEQTYMYYGFDYSKVAIDMASCYNSDVRFYFVADVNNVPIKDNSIDLIIDLLSPYNQSEIKRLLKNNGVFIKVAPGKDYLKEMRAAANISTYDNDEEVEQNLNKNFKVVKKKHILNTFPITKDDFKLLLKMSPMYNDKVFKVPKIITIDLMVYIMNGEKL